MSEEKKSISLKISTGSTSLSEKLKIVRQKGDVVPKPPRSMSKPSDVLKRVKMFLPEMKEAENSLKQRIEAGENVNIEDVNEQDPDGGRYIEMNVGIQKEEEWSSDSESDSSQSPAERDNEFTSDSDVDSSSSSSRSSSSLSSNSSPPRPTLEDGKPLVIPTNSLSKSRNNSLIEVIGGSSSQHKAKKLKPSTSMS